MPILLAIDDNKALLQEWKGALSHDFEVRLASNKTEALKQLSPLPDVVLLDLRLDENDPDSMDGLDLLSVLQKDAVHVPVLIISGTNDFKIAVKCMKQGATDVMQKPVRLPELLARIEKALKDSRLSQETAQLRQQIQIMEPRALVGESLAMQTLKADIQMVAEDDVTVFFRGETGTGKENAYYALHANNPKRKDKPRIIVNLASLSPTLVENELFGHEKGAFDGATGLEFGYLDQVKGGVLVLDEIGEVPVDLQIKLLRVIQEREFSRLGSPQSIKFDAQIIVGTNADIEDKIKEGSFRADFFARLKNNQIFLPPLRERKDDIPLLVDHFLHLFRQRGWAVNGVSVPAMEVLMAYNYPFNVRDLIGFLESAARYARRRPDHIIQFDDLPAEVKAVTPVLASTPTENSAPTKPSLRPLGTGFSVEREAFRVELHYIQKAIKEADGVSAAATSLGYNSRHQPSRRCEIIFNKFPDLKPDFPDLCVKFNI